MNLICSTQSPAMRRFVIRIGVAAGLCVLFGAVSGLTFRLGHPHGVLAYLVAVLPALPIVGLLVATGAYLAEEKDEFQRNLLVQALLGGTGGVLAATTAWGYMENFAHAPHLSLTVVYPAFWVFMMISYAVVWWRYR